MEKMAFKTISNEQETGHVLDIIQHNLGIRLPLAYALKSNIVGVFLQNRLVACYMLVTTPDFRSLMFVPDKVKKTNSFFLNNSSDIMEVNGLWIGPGVKLPSQQIKIWMHLIKDLFLTKKKYVLLMRNLRNQNMNRFLSMANPEVLYEGPTLSYAGESTHNEIQVSYSTRWKIMLNVHKYIRELRSRQRRVEKFSREKDFGKLIKQRDAETI